MFQPITRNVFGNGSVNIEFYNDLIPCRKNNNTHQFKSKLLLVLTNSGSPCCYT